MTAKTILVKWHRWPGSRLRYIEQRLRVHYNYQDADFVKMYENDTEIAAENLDKSSEKGENPVI